jgi:hypothetical protein
VWGLAPGRLNFADLLGSSGFLWGLYERLRSGDFVFKLANCVPQREDRSLSALRKILSRFFGLRIVSSRSTNGMHDGTAKRSIGNNGTRVEGRGLIEPHVCRRAVSAINLP